MNQALLSIVVQQFLNPVYASNQKFFTECMETGQLFLAQKPCWIQNIIFLMIKIVLLFIFISLYYYIIILLITPSGFSKTHQNHHQI